MNNSNTSQIDVLESQLLSKFNEGFQSFEELSDVVQFSESTLLNVLNNLISKNVLKLNPSTKKYEYMTPLEGETIVLDGNFMLPTTIIKTETHLLISRGEWYQFPLDFDTRRIIWNVVLPDNNNSTLINLIKDSAIKPKRSRNQQVPEYKKLVGLIIPWSENVKFEILTVGEDRTDVSIIFCEKLYITPDTKTDYIEMRTFQVRSEIDTKDLISELTCDISQRDFSKIKLNRIYNFSDFIYKNNSIPYKNDGNIIEFVRITGVKNNIQLTFMSLDKTSKEKKLNEEIFTDISEGVERLKTLFESFAEPLIVRNDFMVEYE